MREPSQTDSRRLARHLLCGLAAALLVLACVSQRVNDTPRHGWWAERGSVIPHDNFPADCKLCHTGTNWTTIREEVDFDHHAETGYALEGAHQRAECLRCHNDRGPVQVFVKRGCLGCHDNEHRSKLGDQCLSCHDKTSWEPRAAIREHQRTRFPLVGVHAAVECYRCHPGAAVGEFAPRDIDCVSCHEADAQLTTAPNHELNGMVDNCDRCHIPVSWTGPGFIHPIPLTGRHSFALEPTEGIVLQQCQRCHSNGVGVPPPRGNQCEDCHLNNYQATTNPDHQAGGIQPDCARCHTTEGFEFGVMDHTGIVEGCVTCHQDDYDGTTDPNHAAEGYPTDCWRCHTPDQPFAGTVWDHPWPIVGFMSLLLSCPDCHVNPADFAAFSCIHCKREWPGDPPGITVHSEVRLAPLPGHAGNPAYVWANGACHSGHPDGVAGTASFRLQAPPPIFGGGPESRLRDTGQGRKGGGRDPHEQEVLVPPRPKNR